MVTRYSTRNEKGSLLLELVVAIGILVAVMIPLAGSFIRERALLQRQYQRAILMEVLDGQFEVLMAGEWKGYPMGSTDLEAPSSVLTNAPPGLFRLTISEEAIDLRWVPEGGQRFKGLERTARVSVAREGGE